MKEREGREGRKKEEKEREGRKRRKKEKEGKLRVRAVIGIASCSIVF